ncbi:MAG: acetamidase/formamidase family protein, partial [Clostridia bacterium]
MLTISKKDVTGNLGPDNHPAAFCKSSDTVLFETRDCYDDRLMANGTLLDPENTLSNPATGPLYIEEACPGDILKVEILKISLNPTGIMQALPGAGTFGDLLTEECVRQFSIEDGMV